MYAKPYRDGTSHIVLAPLDLLARLAALVPPPRAHLTRYHGVFAPHAALRAAITPAGRGSTQLQATATEPSAVAKLRTARNPADAESVLDVVSIDARGVAYSAAVVIVGSRVPAEWRRDTDRVLFVPERPYFTVLGVLAHSARETPVPGFLRYSLFSTCFCPGARFYWRKFQ